jgi:hypothetical protein
MEILLGFGRELKKLPLLIFRPQPRRNRFLDILQGFLFILALGDPARKRETFHHHPTVLGRFY